jgi:dephospho-CoA kinase
MTLKVGLTGGIGAGKSTVAKIFEGIGIPVFYADREAKRLLIENEALKQNVISLFGENSYLDGQYNASFIANIVFNNRNMLVELNNLVHPYVFQSFVEWTSKQRNHPYVIKEAALILSSDRVPKLDYLIVVNTDLKQRMERIAKRDSMPLEMIMKRMEAQMDPGVMIEMADSVISNNDEDLLIPQVLRIHEILLSLNKNS